MPKVDWFYFRPGWQASLKAREFLVKHKIETAVIDDARKNILKEKDVRDIFKSVSHLFAARGKKTVHLDLKREKPDKELMDKLILGRTGNLRAPAIHFGKKLAIGFSEDIYKKILGIK